MADKKSKTIAEYAIRKWLAANIGNVPLVMSGREGTITDDNGDNLTLVYDGESREVYVKWD